MRKEIGFKQEGLHKLLKKSSLVVILSEAKNLPRFKTKD